LMERTVSLSIVLLANLALSLTAPLVSLRIMSQLVQTICSLMELTVCPRSDRLVIPESSLMAPLVSITLTLNAVLVCSLTEPAVYLKNLPAVSLEQAGMELSVLQS
jgi:hypothetical protein